MTCPYNRLCVDFEYTYRCGYLAPLCPHFKIFDDYATGKRDRLEIIRELERIGKEKDLNTKVL